MPTSDDVLWGLYQDSVTQGRHHESQRLGMTNAILVATAASLGLVGIDQQITPSDIPVGVFVTALGIFGGLFSLKQYERFRNHMAFAKAYRNALHVDGLGPVREVARASHKKEWENGWRGWLAGTHLFVWWAGLQLLVAALGAAVVIAAALNGS
jgi:hypothetical protein